MIQKLEPRHFGPDSGFGGATFSDVIDKVNEIIDAMNGEHDPADIYSEDGRLIAKKDESEDERIRKELVAFFIEVRNREGNEGYWHDLKVADILSYLEKQKKPKHAPDDLQKSFEAGQTSIVDNPEQYGLCKKPAWSEEDETIIEGACNALEIHGHTKLAERLKSLRPQPKQEWSEEEKGILLECISALQNSSNWLLADKLSSLCPQPKQEWSEEDKKKIFFLSRLIELQVKDEEYCFGEGFRMISKQEAIEMLKSLRPSWKPSEEQMDALAYAIQILDDGLSPKAAKAGEELEHLREKLKKL